MEIEVEPPELEPMGSQNQSVKQFRNPVCEQTFAALPKIYGLRRGSKRPSDKRTVYNNQRLFRPCCSIHEQCKEHTEPSIK